VIGLLAGNSFRINPTAGGDDKITKRSRDAYQMEISNGLLDETVVPQWGFQMASNDTN